MTKKDYIALANAFASAYAEVTVSPESDAWDDAIHGIALAQEYVSIALKRDNPRFDADGFKHAAESRLAR